MDAIFDGHRMLPSRSVLIEIYPMDLLLFEMLGESLLTGIEAEPRDLES
jgi:hypothetical protein